MSLIVRGGPNQIYFRVTAQTARKTIIRTIGADESQAWRS